MTSVGIEPTTSGLDLPLLCRLSYKVKVAQRKSGTILDGESRRRESKGHMNVVLRSYLNPRVVPCFPLLGLTPSGLFMGLSSTLIYTSELILCSTICVPSASAAQHSYVPLLSLRRDSPSKIVPGFLCATL